MEAKIICCGIMMHLNSVANYECCICKKVVGLVEISPPSGAECVLEIVGIDPAEICPHCGNA